MSLLLLYVANWTSAVKCLESKEPHGSQDQELSKASEDSSDVVDSIESGYKNGEHKKESLTRKMVNAVDAETAEARIDRMKAIPKSVKTISKGILSLFKKVGNLTKAR